MENNTTGEKIKTLREYLHLTKTEFGKKINLTYTQVHHLENNQVNFNDQKYRERIIQEICSTFNINPEYFTGRIDLKQAAARTPEYNNIDVGSRIRLLRKEKGMTQAELSAASGTAQSLISSVENGTSRLTEKQADKIAHALETSREYLLYGTHDQKKYPINKELLEWLQKNEQIRKELWQKMKNDN